MRSIPDVHQRMCGALALLALAVACLAPVRAVAQPQSMPTPSDLLLEQLLGRASARASDYFRLFKDLTAEETKTVEQIQSNGEVSRTRRIVSDLIVYTSQLDNGSVSEYRDVREVDGETVAGREQRVQALFAAKDRAGSVRDELSRVNKEGARYDLDYTVSGLTLAEGLPIQAWARALFDFTRAGDERLNGRDAIVIGYSQAVPDGRFGFKLSLPSDVRGAQPLYRGRLWLDADTAQLLKEVRDVTVTTASGPLLVQRTEFAFEPSRYGVPLPSRIVFTSYGHFQVRDGRPTSSPRYRLTFAYGEFRRFTTSSDEGQIAAVAPDGTAPADPLHPDAGLGPEFGDDAPVGPDPGGDAALVTPAHPTSARSPGRLGVSPPAAIRMSVPGTLLQLRPDELRLPYAMRPPGFPDVVVAPPPRPRAPGEPALRPPPS